MSNTKFEEKELTSLDRIKKFIMGGKAIFTIRNENTGKRFTYKFVKSEKNPLVFWVYMLCMADNESKNSYKFIGGFSEEKKFLHSPKAQITGNNSVGIKGIGWYCRHLYKGDIPYHIKLYHLSHCGRCGKPLTVPESIISGFGAECMRQEVNEGNSDPVKKLEKHDDNLNKAKLVPPNKIAQFVQTTFNFFK